jgi:hypothetical protein
VDAAPAVPPALFTQRVTGDFLVTLQCDDVEFGLLRAGVTFSWLVRSMGGAWRLETTSRRADLPRTVTIFAVAAGARIGAMTCRRLAGADVVALLPPLERRAA